MKTIKIIALSLLLSIGHTAFGQAKEEKIKEITFRVEGNCGMCETRIENALRIKGIKLGDWNIETKECRVVYRTDKFAEEEIHQLIADIGHKTSKIEASKEAYSKLHFCCKY